MSKNTATGESVLEHLADKNVEGYRLEYQWRAANRKGSFIKIPDILMSYPELTLTDRLVYSALRAYANSDLYKNLRTSVSNETIGLRLGLGKSSVSKSISHLQSLGIILLKKHPTKNERIIAIARDFYVPLQEQLDGDAAFEREHGCTGESDLTDEWFLTQNAECATDTEMTHLPLILDDDDIPW